jgi:hypothetical protein
MIKRFLKYTLIGILTFVIGLCLYLVIPSPTSLFVKIEEFPPEPPIAVDVAKQCRPRTLYVDKAKGYADSEIIDPRCFELQRLLVEAANEGNPYWIRDAVERGATINSPGFPRGSGDFDRAIVRAVGGKYTTAVKLLLDNGGDVNDSYQCCMTHESLLMIAISNNDVETSKLLLSRGADVNFKSDYEGRTMFDTANEAGHEETSAIFRSACDRNFRCRFESRKKDLLSLLPRDVRHLLSNKPVLTYF